MFKFLIFYLIINCESKRLIEIQCPTYCKCDLFANLRRANCVNKNLVVLQSYLPKQTELLDLSYNQISDLSDHIFFEENLLSLKLLNISNNKLSQIHMNAFDGLNKLKTLDLSFNAMQYILSNWFWSLKSLEELYLHGNSFGRLSDYPLFESQSLNILDISKCRISYIGYDAFAKIPNLRILDVSENYLIQLDVAVVSPLNMLTELRLNNNSFSCNDVLVALARYCARRNIKYNDPCRLEKSQRIVVEMNGTVNGEKRNSWIYYENESGDQINNKICGNNTFVGHDNDDLLMQIIKLSPILFVTITLIYGIAVGLIIGCTVQIKSKRRKFKKATPNRRYSLSNQRHRQILSSARRHRGTDADDSLVLSEWNITESTPVAQRKSFV